MNYDPTVNNMLRVYVDDKPTRYGVYQHWYNEIHGRIVNGNDNRLFVLHDHLINEFGACGWPRVYDTIVRYHKQDPSAT
jgi:hypothetical protein